MTTPRYVMIRANPNVPLGPQGLIDTAFCAGIYVFDFVFGGDAGATTTQSVNVGPLWAQQPTIFTATASPNSIETGAGHGGSVAVDQVDVTFPPAVAGTTTGFQAVLTFHIHVGGDVGLGRIGYNAVIQGEFLANMN